MTSCVHVVSCRFLCLGCRNDQHELFNSSYVRSNQKRSYKLLRCFPHCCPDHVPRSYCGCSLHALVTFASADDATAASQNKDVVVCARFESAAEVALSGAGHVVPALPTDSIVALPSSALQPLAGTSAGGDWMHAKKTGNMIEQQFPENTILYVLNNHRSPQWYYGYESGSTKAQREMKHVLALYVFLLDPVLRESISNQNSGRFMPVARVATVVFRHASPSFTMISYRRQTDVRRAQRDHRVDLAAMPSAATRTVHEAEEAAVSVADTVTPSGYDLASIDDVFTVERVTTLHDEATVPRLQSTSTGLKTIGGWKSGGATSAVQSITTAGPNSTSTALPLGLPSTQGPFGCPICCEPMLIPSHNPHQTTIEKLQPLLLLQLFMRFVPLDAFAFHFVPMDFHIQRQWLAKVTPINRTNPIRDPAADAIARALVVDVASAYSLKNFLTGPPNLNPIAAVTDPLREQMVLRSCADLLLNAFSSPRVQQMLLSATKTSVSSHPLGSGTRSSISSRSWSCKQFCDLVADLSDELSQLLNVRNMNNASFSEEFRDGRTDGPVSIAALVDEVLSLVYAEPKYRALRGYASALLLRKDNTLVVAVQDVFHAFVAQQRQTHDTISLEQTLPIRDSFTGHIDPRKSAVRWGRRWFLVPTSVFITPLTTDTDMTHNATKTNPSLLVVVLMLCLFASIDVKLECSLFTVASALAESTLPQSNMKLSLDGQVHAFNSLPSGLSTTAFAALYGDCWGVNSYEGRVSADGASVDLVLFDLPSEPVATDQLDLTTMSLTLIRPSVNFHTIRLRVALEDTGEEGGECLSVFAEVSASPNSTSHCVRSGVSELKWTPVLEVAATYIGQSAPQS